MKATFEGSPKEFATFLLELQDKRCTDAFIRKSDLAMPLDENLLVSHGLEDGLKSE